MRPYRKLKIRSSLKVRPLKAASNNSRSCCCSVASGGDCAVLSRMESSNVYPSLHQRVLEEIMVDELALLLLVLFQEINPSLPQFHQR